MDCCCVAGVLVQELSMLRLHVLQLLCAPGQLLLQRFLVPRLLLLQLLLVGCLLLCQGRLVCLPQPLQLC